VELLLSEMPSSKRSHSIGPQLHAHLPLDNQG
jgi:hypothetical protein